MELDNNFIISAVNNYFNSVLKNYFNYPETYNIKFDEIKQRITLTSNKNNPILIDLINNKDNKWKIKIEQALLLGFKSKDNNVRNVNIYNFKPNEIIITYTYGETPLTINEIGILAKLVTEYDMSKMDNFCNINTSFARACKDDLFWWEVIKNKYPEYYKEKRKENYNPKEVLRGLYSFLNRGYSYIGEFMVKGFETFKYLILEDLLKIGFEELQYVVFFLSENLTFDNMKILKHIIINHNISGINTPDLFNNLLYNKNFNAKFLDEINELLLSKGITLFDEEMLKDNLTNILTGINTGNLGIDSKTTVKVYDWLSNKLNLNDDDHLSNFNTVRKGNIELMDYIFSKITDNISRISLLEALDGMMEANAIYKFKKLYSQFKWKLNDIDIQDLLEGALLYGLDDKIAQILRN